MQNRIIEWYQEDQFASANLSRVDLFEIKAKRSLSLKSTFELPSQISCISCNAPRGVIAVGQQSGNVSSLHSETSSAGLIYEASTARRPCTAVAWNKHHPNQLAAGFEKSRSQGEFCAVVWDVEGGNGPTDKSLFRPTSEEPTASICWLDAHVLVVGTSISWVRLYDVRVNGGQQGGEIMSIMAHAATRPRKVKGIRCDPLQQHIIATFSDSPGEPIKIWDLRKAGASAKPKLMIVQSQVATVVDVAWSAARAGVLAVATNQSRHVNFYSTVRPVTELISRAPFHTITVADPVKSLSWKMGSLPSPVNAMPQAHTGHGAPIYGLNPDSKNININNNTIESKERERDRERERDVLKEPLRSNRLLVATTSGFADLDVVESVGLGLGAGGCVAVGSGRHVNMVNANIGTAFGAVKHHTNLTGSTVNTGSTGMMSTEYAGSDGRVYTDMEHLMRMRCMKGYSIDAGKNLQVLSDELDFILPGFEYETKKINSLIVKSTSKNMNDVQDLHQQHTQHTTSLLLQPATTLSNNRNIEKRESSNTLSDLVTDEIMDPGSLNSITNQHGGEIPSMRVQVLALTRLWAWVDRVESRYSEGLSVSYCGTINLLANTTPTTSTSTSTTQTPSTNTTPTTTATSTTLCSIHKQLNVAVYTSEKRNLAKELCGWTKMPSTDTVIEKIEISKSATSVKVKGIDRPKSRAGSHDFTVENRIETIKNSTNHDTNTHHTLLSNDMNNINNNNINNINNKNRGGEKGERGVKSNEKDSQCSSSQQEEYNILSELEEVVAECEENDSFGRASAIALFHGDLSLSVSVLQRYISMASNNNIHRSISTSSSQHIDYSSNDYYNNNHNINNIHNNNNNYNDNTNNNNNNNDRNFNSNIQNNENVNDSEDNNNINIESLHIIPFHKNTVTVHDTEFTQLISLTAMCIAGFSSPSPSSNSNINSSSSSGSNSSTGVRTVQPTSTSTLSLTSQQIMWISMCGHVVNQLEAHTGKEKTNNHSSCCYLAAALRFLLDTLHRATSTSTSNSSSSSSSTSHAYAGKKDTTTGSATSPTTSTSSGGFGASASACVVAYDCIVNDERLALEDRVSFACTYLDDQQTLSWLRKVSDDCTRRGDLGGLVVTGLAGEGLDLLQEYLERHDDLQTVALLVGRNVIDTAAMDAAASSNIASGASRGTSLGRSREGQWLWEYRNLLNKMQLFIGRASLDVQLGRRNRLIIRPGPAISTGTGANRGVNPGVNNILQGGNKLRQPQQGVSAGRGAGVVDRKSGSARVLYQLPPHSDLTHVFLRCNYCSSSLPVDPLQQQQAAFFRKQRPLINCCANCKKPLPRCYVCLLYMGLVNPTHEFNRAIVQRRKTTADVAALNQATTNSLSPPTSHTHTNPHSTTNTSTNTNSQSITLRNKTQSQINVEKDNHMNADEPPHNILAFGQWFFFCQHCKHGGHAVCIEDWFQGEGKEGDRLNGREVCGVNGCNCRCRSLK